MVKSDADDDNFSNTDVNADCKCSYIIIPVINAVCLYNMLAAFCNILLCSRFQWRDVETVGRLVCKIQTRSHGR